MITRKKTARPGIALLLGLLIALPGILLPAEEAQALNFHPTETEWLTWPDYCRVRYVVSGAGRDSNFSQRVGAVQVENLRKQLGNDVWHWLHHYCSGLVYLDRAKVEKNSVQRRWLFDEAKNQMMGQYRRVPRTNPFFGITATSISRVFWTRGEIGEALKFAQESMAAQPDYAPAYTLVALIHRKEGNMTKAIQILQAGNEACEAGSAEIHYFLGLMLVDEGDIETAVVHARSAYALGYPLPGLMAKLERLGQTLD